MDNPIKTILAFAFVLLLTVGTGVGGCAAWNNYRVYSAQQAGRAVLAEAESSRQVKTLEARATMEGDICPTEFAVGKASYTDTPLFSPHPIYKVWHEQVEQDIAEGVLERVPVPTNRLIHFDCNAFHQGTRAVKRGWRWFGRLSWDAGYEQGRPHFNEVRRQVQVYLEHPMEGW